MDSRVRWARTRPACGCAVGGYNAQALPEEAARRLLGRYALRARRDSRWVCCVTWYGAKLGDLAEVRLGEQGLWVYLRRGTVVRVSSVLGVGHAVSLAKAWIADCNGEVV